MRAGGLLVLAFLPLVLNAETDFDRAQIQQRIKPVGDVRIKNEATLTTAENPPSNVEKKEVVKMEPGQAVYEQYCVTCHRDGVAGAPKFRIATDWTLRLAQKDMNGLVATVTKGLNAMPPKGTCAECSEADIKAAIEYMVPKGPPNEISK